jgi:hypothetical protein
MTRRQWIALHIADRRSIKRYPDSPTWNVEATLCVTARDGFPHTDSIRDLGPDPTGGPHRADRGVLRGSKLMTRATHARTCFTASQNAASNRDACASTFAINA